MTTLGNCELFECRFFGCVVYRRYCLDFYIKVTIRYTTVLLMGTIVLPLQGLLLT